MAAGKGAPSGADVGLLLDRLLLLEQFIPPAEAEQVLSDCGCIDSRRCTLSFRVTLWLVVAMGVLTDLPMRAVFKASVSLHRLAGTPTRSALCMARQRLGIGPLRRLFYRVARPLARPGTPGCFYDGLRLVAIDGTVLSVPDSQANARAFGRASAGPRGQAAFPQVRKLSLVECGTHAELAFAVRGVNAKGGERGMTPALLKHVGAGMLLLLDRGFYSYALWGQAAATGAGLLARLSSRLKLPPRAVLADGSYLSEVYPDASARDAGRGGITVRVIRYTHDDPRRVGRGQEHRLLTTLLDAQRYPAAELACLYHERWEIELTYDEQKTHHAPAVPGKEAQLRSESPAGVIQELYALSLGHYLTRAFMAQAASGAGLDPDRLSFVGCMRVLRNRMPEYPAVARRDRPRWYAALLAELAGERNPPRRNRVNPRVVKVKMSKFKKKRAGHRGIRPLTQTFQQSVVVLR
jgi:Insertion element 4 transposase N-terminal/Transposase DDE domain